MSRGVVEVVVSFSGWDHGYGTLLLIDTRAVFNYEYNFDICIPSPSLSTSMTSQDQNTESSSFYILAAHGGAGFHPPTSDSSLKCSLREAISSALTAFSDATTTSGNAPESPALDAATTIIAALEDAPDFNAGYGSNLTFDGDVECDASLMSTEEVAAAGAGAASPDHTPPSPPPSSSYSFGSVGAVRGVRNPVLLARRVLEGRRRRHQPGLEEEEKTQMRMRMRMMMGRVPPLMLVGEGALQFAKEEGLRVVDRSEEEEQMVSPRARREWRVWRERWDRCCRLDEEGESRDDAERPHGDSDVVGIGSGSGSSSDLGGGGGSVLTPRAGSDGGGEGDVETLRARQDTVGAVVLVGGADDVHRQVAAGVSRCVGVLPKFFDFIRSSFISMPSSSHPYPPALNFFSLTAVVCYSSTLDALARSVGRFRHRCNETCGVQNLFFLSSGCGIWCRLLGRTIIGCWWLQGQGRM